MEDMPQRVIIAIYDGFQLLDMAGPADVFGIAAMIQGHQTYRIEIAAVDSGAVRALNGVSVNADIALGEITADFDTLLVVGGTPLNAPALIGEISRLSHHARRVVSVCNGALLLAAAGLLRHKRATTHWLAAEELAAYHEVTVDSDAIYIKDGDLWTSAGVTAGIDLALALVTEDHGAKLARDIARGLVMYLHRPGGQSQFSTALSATKVDEEPFHQLQVFIDSNPTADLSVPALAQRLNMSHRHFSRVFTAQFGVPPGRYVERSRAENARRLVETTAHSFDRVAKESGLGSAETLYRTFRRHWRISPGDHRRRFHIKEKL